MRRREFIAAACIGAAFAEPVRAAQSCGVHQGLGPTCTAFVQFSSKIFALTDVQYQSEWCWAACISNLFRYYGYNVSQARIVAEAYGAPANIPGMPITMSQALNRNWDDDAGANFTSTLVGAYDQMSGIVAINDQMIVASLQNDRPLIIGAAGHAMVLTAVEYGMASYGLQIVGGLVFDPWPGRGVRPLAPAELTPVFKGGALMYIADVQVD